MQARVVFYWKERSQGNGTTRDVSTTGAYVLTSECPSVNATVHMEILFSFSSATSCTKIGAEMEVVRVEHDIGGAGRSGFSAVGKGFSLQFISNSASVLECWPSIGAKACLCGDEK